MSQKAPAAQPTKTRDVDPGDVRGLRGFDRGRPVYFDNEVVDHLITVVLELGAEIWVLRDRQAHTEELLAARGIDLAAELDRGHPSDALQARLKGEREQMIARIYGSLYSKYGGDRVTHKAAILKST
jgi:hypothetical protein